MILQNVCKICNYLLQFTTKSYILQLFVANGKLSSLLYRISALLNANNAFNNADESCLQHLSSWYSNYRTNHQGLGVGANDE